MTEKQALQWIKNHLGPFIIPAIAGTVYTEDWLAAMAFRETGIIILRNAETKTPAEMWPLFKGDYGQRPRKYGAGLD